jgi:anti-sigma factor RsiW
MRRARFSNGLLAALVLSGSAAAQQTVSPPQKPDVSAQASAPVGQENLTVKGRHLVPAPVPNRDTARAAGTQRPDPLVPQPSVMPRSYCQNALQNDVSGQPGNGQTLTSTCK